MANLRTFFHASSRSFVFTHIYGINTFIKCGTWQSVKLQLVSRSWNEMIVYRISELMLPTLIQRYDKNHLIFDPVLRRGTNWIFTCCQMPHFTIVWILHINLLNLSWIKRRLFLRNTESLCLLVFFVPFWSKWNAWLVKIFHIRCNLHQRCLFL